MLSTPANTTTTVIRLRGAERTPDGASPIRLYDDVGAGEHSAAHLSQDLVWILRTRIVGGEDGEIGRRQRRLRMLKRYIQLTQSFMNTGKVQAESNLLVGPLTAPSRVNSFENGTRRVRFSVINQEPRSPRQQQGQEAL